MGVLKVSDLQVVLELGKGGLTTETSPDLIELNSGLLSLVLMSTLAISRI